MIAPSQCVMGRSHSLWSCCITFLVAVIAALIEAQIMPFTTVRSGSQRNGQEENFYPLFKCCFVLFMGVKLENPIMLYLESLFFLQHFLIWCPASPSFSTLSLQRQFSFKYLRLQRWTNNSFSRQHGVGVGYKVSHFAQFWQVGFQ